MNSKTLIIIPTYNECLNIQKLYAGLRKYSVESTILFVDGNSEDDTQKRIQILAEADSKVFTILKSDNEGFAKAYLDGFEWGLERDFEFFQQMDADLSHDPLYLPRFTEAIKSCDFVVGSRHVSEGDVSGWRQHRKYLSISGSVYARLVLANPILDLTGGYNCWSRRVLESINFDHLVSKGFSIQIELKHIAVKNGFSFQEIPFHFRPRKVGYSKMSLKIFLEGLFYVPLFRLKH
ncbi:MAG: polyprenol monophosphomannose synthase [Proteobacteria bacterium]|nr:polyprenol monophosphomannose synthase [Pseudomonadota bacterium]